MKKQKRNPAYYQYGYHFTNDLALEAILKSGMLKIEKPSRGFESIYGVKPLYFLTHSKIDFIPETLQFVLSSNSKFLKIDVSTYNQYPDFGSLKNLDFEIFYSQKYISYWPRENFIKKPPKTTVKWIKKFNNNIPFKEFMTNPYLIKDFISATHTFAVLENIPISKILNIYNVPVDDKTFDNIFRK